MNYYEILGVKKLATNSDIKKAFNKLSLKYHPDKYDGPKSDYQRVMDAYTTLSNAHKRLIYDNKINFGELHPARSFWDQSHQSDVVHANNSCNGLNKGDIVKIIGKDPLKGHYGIIIGINVGALDTIMYSIELQTTGETVRRNATNIKKN